MWKVLYYFFNPLALELTFKFYHTLEVKYEYFMNRKYKSMKYRAFCEGKKVEILETVSENLVSIFVD
jgi:hypothetical protein